MVPKIIEELKDKKNKINKILYLMEKPDFRSFFDDLEDKATIRTLIDSLQIDLIKSYMCAKISESFGDKTIRQLRDFASTYAIANYSRLNKDQLIVALTQVQYAFRTEKESRGMSHEQKSIDRDVKESGLPVLLESSI